MDFLLIMKTQKWLFFALCSLVLSSCQTQLVAKGKTIKDDSKKQKVSRIIYGEVSWYEIKCNGGTQTASGIPLRDNAMTAAHKTLPMGTKVRVTNENNGKSVVLKITDRGPYIKGRVIDVTKGAAKKLGLIHCGIAPCKVEVLVAKTSKSKKKKAK